VKLVTIKTFTNSFEANITKGRLESEGIKCFLKNEKIINTDLLLSSAIGGIKLQVKEKDVKNALIFIQ
jgi:hypothetical protein